MGPRKGLAFLLFSVLFANVSSAQTDDGEMRSVDILVTSYRGAAVDDISKYHDGHVGQDFVRELQADDDERYCLAASTPTPAAGLWEGNLEPTYWVETKGQMADVEAFAVSHAQKHDQDAVLVFEHDPTGPDAEYMLSLPATIPVKEAVLALRDGGFKGATIIKGTMIIVDEKAVNENAARQVARALGAELEIERGHMNLITRDKYGDIESASLTTAHTCKARTYNPASTKEQK